MLGLIHAEEENPERTINAADETEIPEIPFNEAMQFLKSKVPMSKAEWNQAWKEIGPKVRFRAFTVAQLGSAEVVDKAKQILLKSFEKGGGTYSDTWEELKKKVNVNALDIKPGYWENVFRTNTQSAYIAGKLQQYENTGVAAYQLMVIEDGRTSKICRHLLTASGYGMIISVDHPFWKKYGFPPYHFQCRTSIRAIWPSQVGKLGNMVENPTMKSLSKFKVQEGFGGNPLDRGSWWEMTDSMKRLAEKFGIMEKISAKKEFLINRNIHTNFTPSKSIKDAQSYAEKTFIQRNGLDGVFNGTVDFTGISLENANEINRVLSERFKQFPELPKLSGLKAVSPSSKLGKKAFSSGESMASYDLVRNGIFLNKDILKNEKAFQKFIEDSRIANEFVMKNVEKLSGAQKALVERYIKAGRALVDGESIEGILNHELAHHMELNFIRTNKELYSQLIKNMNIYAGRISGYATSAGNEYLAESIAAYMKGEKEIIDPLLLKSLESQLSAKGLKTIIKEVAEINCVIPEAKLTKYVLDTIKYGDKAKVFKSALGYTIDNWQDLEQNILANVEKYPMVFVESKGKWGDTFRCDMLLKGPNGKEALVRTGWILRPGTDVYQFTTAYVL